MPRFFTADQHFGHANILKYEDENRRNQYGGRFQSVQEMDEYLIERWNSVVSTGDTVYCLGDFSYKQYTMESVNPRLNGEKILIVGNHDPFLKRLTLPLSSKMHGEAHDDAQRAGFSGINLGMDIEIAGVGLVRMSHFPYWPEEPDQEEEYNLRCAELRPAVGSECVLMHGHIHSQWLVNKAKTMPLQVNVGVDMWSMTPASESAIVELYQAAK